jgi:hypothetical protein
VEHYEPMTYTVANHPYEVDVFKLFIGILLVTKHTDLASPRLEFLLWDGISRLSLEKNPVHRCLCVWS